MSATTEDRRESQRRALIVEAERAIAAHGPGALKARELAAEVGVSLGAIYNLVEDLDELALRVDSRTLARLDAALGAAAEQATRAAAPGREAASRHLVAIALAYRRFADENANLWRALFDFQRHEGRPPPDWAAGEQMALFRHIKEPLNALMPQADEAARLATSATLFSAVHGVVWLAYQKRLVAVPLDKLDSEIERLVSAIADGLR
jgi:AcrR family transcriptional regulator